MCCLVNKKHLRTSGLSIHYLHLLLPFATSINFSCTPMKTTMATKIFSTLFNTCCSNLPLSNGHYLIFRVKLQLAKVYCTYLLYILVNSRQVRGANGNARQMTRTSTRPHLFVVCIGERGTSTHTERCLWSIRHCPSMHVGRYII